MDFIYQLGGIENGRRRHQGPVPQRARRNRVRRRPRSHVGERVHLDHTIFAEDFEFLQSRRRRRRDAEADDPVAEHGPLPRRAGGDRPERLPATSTSSGPTSPAPTPTRCARVARARLHVPAVRRHEPRLPERPAPARADGAARARTSSTCTRPTCATSTRRSPAGPTGWRSRPTCAAATSAPRGRPRAATTSSPRRCSATSTSTASSSSTTTPARAGSSRCGSSPKGKMVVLGLVTTKRGELESKDELKRRIEEAVPVRRRSSSCASRPSAASRRRSRATS